MSKEKEQINLWVDEGTKEKLKRLANIKSLERNESITYLELLKEAIDFMLESSGSMEIVIK